MGPLAGKVALVLAKQGSTVYVTGRTVSAGIHPLPGSIGETAAECDKRGGKGIAVKIMVSQQSGLIVGISGYVGVTYTY